ncbi:MAG: hypothetical protein JWO46_1653 [Nocardioidaceae bacterium]|nr:hypothetical protein [Nocardioidaceae bacterium]
MARYPVKSCRGESLETATVEPWGLAGDRRWMVVDGDGEVITARECPVLVLVHPVLTEDGLTLTGPDRPTLDVRRPEQPLVPVTIWNSQLEAAYAGADAERWFTGLIGRTARLVHLDDPTRRHTSPDFGDPDDLVSFADGYPMLLATEASLAALNDAILERHDGAIEPLPMTRFRPSLVVAGSEAWAEDDWRRVRIGAVEFRAVKGCARCVLTTIDPDTAAKGKEPIATLARIRRWDGATWFAVNLVPDTPGAVLRVGDEVEVLEAVPPGGGPVRPSARSRSSRG